MQFRLGRRELPLVAAVFLGFLGEVEFDGHGEAHDKRLTIVDQGGKLFFKIVQGRAAHAVPATAAEVVELACRAMHALSLNAPGIDTQTLARMVRRAGQMEAAAQQMKESTPTSTTPRLKPGA